MKRFLSFCLVSVLTVSILSVTALADTNDAARNAGNNDYSVQEILNRVNEKYGTDINLIAPDGQKVVITLTAEELESHLESEAKKIAEDNAAAIRLYEDRTGMSYNSIQWIAADANSNKGEVQADVAGLQRGLQSYVSTQPTWQTAWINVTLQGIINIDSSNVHKFSQVDKVTCSISTANYLLGWNYSMSSYSYSYLDQMRTCAVTLTGTEYNPDPQIAPGYIRSFSSTKYVEFYA